jgi:hypothetical protein
MELNATSPAQYSLSLWITGDTGGQPIYDGDVRVALDVAPARIFPSGREPHSRMGIAYFPLVWRVPATKQASLTE